MEKEKIRRSDPIYLAALPWRGFAQRGFWALAIFLRAAAEGLRPHLHGCTPLALARFPNSRQLQLGNIVSGVFAPLLAKHTKQPSLAVESTVSCG